MPLKPVCEHFCFHSFSSKTLLHGRTAARSSHNPQNSAGAASPRKCRSWKPCALSQPRIRPLSTPPQVRQQERQVIADHTLVLIKPDFLAKDSNPASAVEVGLIIGIFAEAGTSTHH
jgi:hypothetical protein